MNKLIFSLLALWICCAQAKAETTFRSYSANTSERLPQTDSNKVDSIKFEKIIEAVTSSKDSSYYFLLQAEEMAKTEYQKAKATNARVSYYYYTKRDRKAALEAINTDMSSVVSDAPLEYYLEITWGYWFIARVHQGSTDQSKTMEALRQGISIMEKHTAGHDRLAIFYEELGTSYFISKNYPEAEKWWFKCIEYSQERNFLNGHAGGYYHLALLYFQKNQWGKSKQYYNYVVHLFESQNQKMNSANYLTIQNAIGNIYRKENKKDSAVLTFQIGLDFLRDSIYSNARHDARRAQGFEATFLNNLSGTLRDLGRYEEAKSKAQKALELNELLHGENSHQLIKPLRALGNIDQHMRDYQSAKSHFLKSLELSKSNNFQVGAGYSQVGGLLLETKEYTSSKMYYDSAFVYCSTQIGNKEFLLSNSRDFVTVLNGWARLARLDNDNGPDKAEELYEHLNTVSDMVLSELPYDSYAQVLSETLEIIYDLYSELYESDKKGLWLNRQWEIMEMSRSRKLLSQLKNTYSQNFSLPDTAINRISNVKDSLNQALAKAVPGKFDSASFILNARYEDILSELEAKYPRYASLVNTQNSADIIKFKKALPPDEMVMSFFEGDSTVKLIKVTANEIERLEVNKSEVLDYLEIQNQEILLNHSTETSPAARLMKAFGLGQEQLEDYEIIRIIPDGIIWKLNFAALRATEDDPYLGNSHDLVFKYYLNDDIPKAKDAQGQVLAFSFNVKNDDAPVTFSTLRDTDASLPGTSKEVVSISELLDGDYFFAQSANESLFKERATEFSVLHLALHGYEDPDSYENSYLQFSDADSTNDGKLHAYEIYNLDLNADLAVLSACNTGSGQVSASEGMMSLGRAFSYAGVRSLLISRWEVSDYSAPHLMKYFYSGLKKGMRKSEALRYAQTEYLKNHSDDLTASPFYWSSFYVLGDDSPIYQSAKVGHWMLLWAVLIIAAASVALRRKRTITN